MQHVGQGCPPPTVMDPYGNCYLQGYASQPGNLQGYALQPGTLQGYAYGGAPGMMIPGPGYYSPGEMPSYAYAPSVPQRMRHVGQYAYGWPHPQLGAPPGGYGPAYPHQWPGAIWPGMPVPPGGLPGLPPSCPPGYVPAPPHKQIPHPQWGLGVPGQMIPMQCVPGPASAYMPYPGAGHWPY